MFLDNQTEIIDLMMLNKFQLMEANTPERLEFRRAAAGEIVEVTISCDLPAPVETRLKRPDVSPRWVSKTMMVADFEMLKAYAEAEVKDIVDNLQLFYLDYLRQESGSGEI